MIVSESLEKISELLEQINLGQAVCNKLLENMTCTQTFDGGMRHYGPDLPATGLDIAKEATIKQLKDELAEANEKLAEAKKRSTYPPDPFNSDNVVGHGSLSYWKELIDRHVTDAKFTSFDHAITHLIDKYPNRKEA